MCVPVGLNKDMDALNSEHMTLHGVFARISSTNDDMAQHIISTICMQKQHDAASLACDGTGPFGEEGVMVAAPGRCPSRLMPSRGGVALGEGVRTKGGWA